MFFPNGNSFDDYIAKKIVDEYRTMNGRPEQDAPVTHEGVVTSLVGLKEVIFKIKIQIILSKKGDSLVNDCQMWQLEVA
ncbi:MAG: hypothetical protein APF81_25360 [Desulfosporosinus sp. BRH_c37]|nr:MAG: hypothetical protein APF81_25360 [Desulfosporosinus sp. BRH_c37]